MGFESSCFEEAAGDVVGEVAEAEGGAAQVFESAVDRRVSSGLRHVWLCGLYEGLL